MILWAVLATEIRMVHIERDAPVVIMKRSLCVRRITQREQKHSVGLIRVSAAGPFASDDTPLK